MQSERVGERVDGKQVPPLEESFASEVYADGIEAQVGGENLTVVRQDVAALGAYGVGARQLDHRLGIPFWRGKHRVVKREIHHSCHK